MHVELGIRLSDWTQTFRLDSNGLKPSQNFDIQTQTGLNSDLPKVQS
ncbi:38102_t:CDS:2 [Gigaspora margarita]|uniref:38102_t:CDS:1 n=1 Tax=Gigaspora margarita TaxID=4874 RepID=A0ABM8VYE7_GIGMA|nr:38102_t:CDS:2 [Gigaspora margarita]